MNKPFNKLTYKEKLAKIKSNTKYYFAKNFLSDDVKIINKKEFKNGSWIEYKQLEIFDQYTNKTYKYHFSCKYSLDKVLKVCGKPFINCLYVSKYKLQIV